LSACTCSEDCWDSPACCSYTSASSPFTCLEVCTSPLCHYACLPTNLPLLCLSYAPMPPLWRMPACPSLLCYAMCLCSLPAMPLASSLLFLPQFWPASCLCCLCASLGYVPFFLCTYIHMPAWGGGLGFYSACHCPALLPACHLLPCPACPPNCHYFHAVTNTCLMNHSRLLVRVFAAAHSALRGGSIAHHISFGSCLCVLCPAASIILCGAMRLLWTVDDDHLP